MLTFEERCEFTMAIAETMHCISEQALQVIYDRKASKGKKPLRTPNPKTNLYTLTETQCMIELIGEKLAENISTSSEVEQSDDSCDDETELNLVRRYNDSQKSLPRNQPTNRKSSQGKSKNRGAQSSQIGQPKGTFTAKNWSTPSIPQPTVASSELLRSDSSDERTESFSSEVTNRGIPYNGMAPTGKLSSYLQCLSETNNQRLGTNASQERENMYSDISTSEDESREPLEPASVTAPTRYTPKNVLMRPPHISTGYYTAPVGHPNVPTGYSSYSLPGYSRNQENLSHPTTVPPLYSNGATCRPRSLVPATELVSEESSPEEGTFTDYGSNVSAFSTLFSPSMLPKPREEYDFLSSKRQRFT